MAEGLPDSKFWKFLAFISRTSPGPGCSLHDLIQPSFSFLVGVALPFSIASRVAKGQSRGWMVAHAVWRAIVLMLLGVFLRSMGTAANELDVRRHAVANRLWLCAAVSARLYAKQRWQWAALVVDPRRLLGGVRALSIAAERFRLSQGRRAGRLAVSLHTASRPTGTRTAISPGRSTRGF